MLNDKQVRTLRKYLPNSALFDLIMFCLFLVFLPFIRPLLDKEIVYTPENVKYLSWKVGVIYLCAAAAQVVGFWLKRNRIAQAFNHHAISDDSDSMNLLGGLFVSLMHLILFGVLIVNDGINYVNNQSVWWLTVIKAVSVVLPTVSGLATIYYANRSKHVERLSAVNTFWDVLGTALLAFSCFVVVGSLWELLLGDVHYTLHDGKVVINFLLSIVFLLAFLIIYLPTRWAFLLTDYRSIYTWLRMAIVFLPFLRLMWI
jgi:hypothetical protein